MIEDGSVKYAEYPLVFTAGALFDAHSLREDLRLFIAAELTHPLICYLRDENGDERLMFHPDAPQFGDAVTPSWSLATNDAGAEERIFEEARKCAAFLRAREEGFVGPDPEKKEISDLIAVARSICNMRPRIGEITALPSSAVFDGPSLCADLASIGLQYDGHGGFNSSIAERAETRFFSALPVDESDNGVDPALVESGAQHFKAVRFMFVIGQTTEVFEVLGEMIQTAHEFAERTQAQLQVRLDGAPVVDDAELIDATMEIYRKLGELGFKPGDVAVRQLLQLNDFQ